MCNTESSRSCKLWPLTDRRLRGLAIGIGVGLAAALLAGCMRCSRAEKFESYVDEPTTLEAVEALRDPPDVVVEVTEGPKESAGSASCGHSPVCIILLPAVVEDLA